MKFTTDNLEQTSSQFHDILFNQKEGEIGRKFLLNRNLGDLNSFKHYEIGYCPPDFDYPSSQSLYSDNKLWWLRGRLIVTIRDQHNRIVSFAGRVIDENKNALLNDLINKIPLMSNINEEKVKDMVEEWVGIKWINEIYPKKEHLFGLNMAKKHIFENKYAIVVEGYMDVIALWMNGFLNTVALCGVAMSDVHSALLRRYTEGVVFCLDADENKSGSKAIKSIEKLMNKEYNDLNHYVIYLPLKEKSFDPEDALIDVKYKSLFTNALKEAGRRVNDLSIKKRFLDLSDDLTVNVLKGVSF